VGDWNLVSIFADGYSAFLAAFVEEAVFSPTHILGAFENI
jgi:hypothetical protein